VNSKEENYYFVPITSKSSASVFFAKYKIFLIVAAPPTPSYPLGSRGERKELGRGKTEKLMKIDNNATLVIINTLLTVPYKEKIIQAKLYVFIKFLHTCSPGNFCKRIL